MGLGPPSTLVRSFLGSPFYSPHQRTTAPAAAACRGTWTRGLSRGIQRPKAATDQSVCCWLRSGPVRLFPLAVARALASFSSSYPLLLYQLASVVRLRDRFLRRVRDASKRLLLSPPLSRVSLAFFFPSHPTLPSSPSPLLVVSRSCGLCGVSKIIHAGWLRGREKRTVVGRRRLRNIVTCNTEIVRKVEGNRGCISFVALYPVDGWFVLLVVGLVWWMRGGWCCWWYTADQGRMVSGQRVNTWEIGPDRSSPRCFRGHTLYLGRLVLGGDHGGARASLQRHRVADEPDEVFHRG